MWDVREMCQEEREMDRDLDREMDKRGGSLFWFPLYTPTIGIARILDHDSTKPPTGTIAEIFHWTNRAWMGWMGWMLSGTKSYIENAALYLDLGLLMQMQFYTYASYLHMCMRMQESSRCNLQISCSKCGREYQLQIPGGEKDTSPWKLLSR